MCWGENSLLCAAIAFSFAADNPHAFSSLYLRQWLFIRCTIATGKGPITSELPIGLRERFLRVVPSVQGMLQLSVHPSVPVTARDIHSLLATLTGPIHHCSHLHCSSPRGPDAHPCPTRIPHTPASHACLLCAQLPPIRVCPSSTRIASSVSFPR